MDIIRIVNHEKYNPRTDRKKHSWVRVDNTLAYSDDLEGLDPDQKWFWIFIITQASFKQKDTIELNYSYFEKHSGVSLKKMKSALDHFEKRQMIQIVPRSVTSGNQSVTSGNQSVTERLPVVPDRCPTIQTDNTDITDDTDTTPKVKVASPDMVLFNHWNNLTDDNGDPLNTPKVEKLSDGRKEKIRCRLEKIKLDELIRAMDDIKKYPFLLGAGDHGWIVDFDWLIANDTNYLKILEGKYRIVGNGSKKSQAQKNFDIIDDQARRIIAGTL